MGRNSIFDPENGFFRTLALGVDVVGLSLLWVLLSLPLVTMGPATAALYHTAVRCVAHTGDSTYRTFFRSFVQNLRVGVPAGVLALAALLAMSWGCQVMVSAANALGGAAMALAAAYLVILVLPLGAVCWMFPLLSRFHMGVGHLLLTSLQVAVRHLPSTVLLVLTVLALGFGTLLFFPLCLVAPSCAALLCALPAERVIRRYLPPGGDGTKE